MHEKSIRRSLSRPTRTLVRPAIRSKESFSLFGLLSGQLSSPRQEAVSGGVDDPEERVVRRGGREEFAEVPA